MSTAPSADLAEPEPLPSAVDPAAALAWTGLLAGLGLSGVAGIVNQVLWQRALKIFLGGSETLSAMVVVLVFLFGLGAGAALAGRVAHRLPRPLVALALVELGLATGNALVALLLGLDVSESVYTVQRLAVASGIPLRAGYALGSALLLLPPTLAMGATLPLASEACQRELRASSSRLVPVLLFVNTFGAAFGAYSASAWLLPTLGQRRSLLVAVASNLAASALVGVAAVAAAAVARRLGAASEAPLAARPAPAAPSTGGWPTRDERVGFALGFLALGYEMALFRVLALSHKPVPTTFATGLASFLLAWSVGAALSSGMRRGVPVVALSAAAAVACVPFLYDREVWEAPLPLLAAASLYAAPCAGFGALYGLLVARSSTVWGRDVGRFTALNTLGSCLGIVAYTLVGYELPQELGLRALALGLAAVAIGELPAPPGPLRVARAIGVASACALSLGAVAVGWTTPYTTPHGVRTYWGRDGVVEVARDGNVYLDGLWHTKLSDGADHIGTPYSWTMAFAAVLAHHGRPDRALVIGAGVGISSATLAGVDGLDVEGYEINHTLMRVLRDYPDGALRSLQPNVRWIWQDARTGLALNPARYDIILSAPLYLRQAGSSLLLSAEYLRLAKSRLEPGGVLAVYANEGSPAQTRLIQRTLAELFAYRVSWYDGIVTVASDAPVALTRERFEQRIRNPDRLFAEARGLDAELAGKGGLYGWYDGDVYVREQADRVISDDQPLVEYPELAERRVGLVIRDTPR